ncbi:hypothetical protein BPC006_I4053 [Burkholderia pseudomallei BPC006]|nr:hypothetical protein BPC006_I4053 [Burkholderia pseudomallei BPC006]
MRRADATRTAARNSRHCGGDSGTGSAMRRRCCLRASRGIGIASRSHESAAEADSEVRRELGFDRFQPADVVTMTGHAAAARFDPTPRARNARGCARRSRTAARSTCAKPHKRHAASARRRRFGPRAACHPRCAETAVPHCGQKRAEAASGARHAPQTGGVCDAPHCAQNFASAPLIAPHFAHAACCAGAPASPRSGAPSRASFQPPPRCTP